MNSTSLVSHLGCELTLTHAVYLCQQNSENVNLILETSHMLLYVQTIKL